MEQNEIIEKLETHDLPINKSIINKEKLKEKKGKK